MTDRESCYRRHRLLRIAASAVALGLAGCSENGQSTPTPNETETGTPERTPTYAELCNAALGFTEQLAAGEYGAAREVFTHSVAEQVSVAALEAIWADLQRANGAYVGIEGTERVTVQSFVAVVVTLQFPQARQGLRMVFDEEGRVVGFQLVAPASADWTPPSYLDQSVPETRERCTIYVLKTLNGTKCPLFG